MHEPRYRKSKKPLRGMSWRASAWVLGIIAVIVASVATIQLIEAAYPWLK